jgi:predicted PhzF superfamily epimerase YddE/YHI9
LTGYLFRHQLVNGSGNSAEDVQTIEVTAEQGHEVGRPSRIHSKVHSCAGVISRLQVGGVASKIIEGDFYL